MSDTEDASTLTEDDQSTIALEWHISMWDELIKRGIEPSAIALSGLSLTANKTVSIFGRDQAITFIDKIRDKIVAGIYDESIEYEQKTHEK